MMSHVNEKSVHRQVRKERGCEQVRRAGLGIQFEVKEAGRPLEKVTSEQKLEDQGGNHAKSGERGFQGKGKLASAKVRCGEVLDKLCD